jgi:eukaryotic-like serine/threonine-protein kinase
MTSPTDNTESGAAVQLAPVREGEVLEGKYVVGRQLGAGGMGVVLAARDDLLDRNVAIKFLLPRLAHSERAVQRFIREARAASRITNEHVVRLLEISRLPDGTPYFVMEYLEGQDLGAALEESGVLRPALAVDYVLQALEVVAEGHQLGIIHRDLKPGNLFVTRRADGTPLIKVLDFGIAKTLDADSGHPTDLTGSGETKLGSPAYMSPEQLQSPSEVDARSDVWALGVTLYELLTGSHPFSAHSYPDLVYSIRAVAPEPPSKRRPDLALPSELDQVVMRCLEKAKDARYTTAREVAAALAPFGSDDARASFKRIRGLTSQRPREEPFHMTTTLPGVDAAPPSTAPDRPSTSPRARRVVAAALVGAVLVILFFAHARDRRAGAPPVQPPSAVGATEARSAPPERESERVAGSGLEVAPLTEALEPAPPTTLTSVRADRVARPQRTASQEAKAVPSASVEVPAPPPSEVPPSADGRSPLIESLITKRR